MKTCFKCKELKPLADYYVHKRMKDGRLGKCKECVKKDTANNKTDYGLTKKGVVRVIYKTQVRSSKVRGHPRPEYSKEELRRWMVEEGFDCLYEKWIGSGMKKDMKPSVDRIDDNKPYSFCNIKLGTWLDNRLHQYDDIRKGVGTSGARCKPILCLTKSGNLVAEYVSYSMAKKVMGYSVWHQLKKGVSCRNGYFWRYKQPID